MKSLITLLLNVSLLVSPVLASAATPMRAFEPDSLAQIAAQHQGKPFMLMIWSLDCEFCHASMKNLVAEKRLLKNINIVTVSTDAVDDPQAVSMMQKRLAGLHMMRNAWAFGAAPPEQLRYVIDPKWHGEKPRTYWFNARGEKVAYSGLLTPALIGKLSAQALAR